MSLDWETEEEINWDDIPEIDEPTEKQERSSRFSWRWFVLVIFVLGAVLAGVVWSRLQQQVETAEDETAVDILTSYDLLNQSAQNQDVDIFTSLLSGRSDVWANGQANLVLDGAYFDRPMFNLTYIGLTQEPDFTFSPALMTADMNTLTAYSFPVGNGVTETVVFSQTAVYRRGETKWLYSPPDGEYWGENQTLNGQLLQIQYPARDEALIQQLAPHLESKVFETCQILQAGCPENGQLMLTFSMNPDSLSHNYPIDSENLVLPSPSLLGTPMDDVGFLALQQGYTQRLIGALVEPPEATNSPASNDVFW